MLNEQEVRDKLHDYADQFQLRCRRKEWAAAKMLYFRAQTVATFLEFPEAELAKLFGNRAYREDWEPLKDGLFPERDVERAGWECVRIHRTYDDLHLRPLPRYGPMYVKGGGKTLEAGKCSYSWRRQGREKEGMRKAPLARGGFSGDT